MYVSLTVHSRLAGGRSRFSRLLITGSSRDRTGPISRALSLTCSKVKMAVGWKHSHLHFNSAVSSLYEHLLSYDSLTTLLINLTMEGTHSGINSHSRRQVNKGVLEKALSISVLQRNWRKKVDKLSFPSILSKRR